MAALSSAFPSRSVLLHMYKHGRGGGEHFLVVPFSETDRNGAPIGFLLLPFPNLLHLS
jgi:hypothetical protein